MKREYREEKILNVIKGFNDILEITNRRAELIKKQKQYNMKTKVTVLGEEPKEKELKPIEFHGCLVKGCDSVNYDSFDKDFVTPSNYKEIILIKRDYGPKDVSLCKKHNGDEVIMFGKFNDGVVEQPPVQLKFDGGKLKSVLERM